MVFRVAEIDRTPDTARADRLVVVDFFRAVIPGPGAAFFIGIDLDNAGGAGAYKHAFAAGQFIQLLGFTGFMAKSNMNGDWEGIFGTILAINGVSADIGWLQTGALRTDNTLNIETERVVLTFPVRLSLEVAAGDYTKIAAGFKETVAAVNTGITLPDVAGVLRTPAVGDLIIRADKLGGAGTADLHYQIHYTVETP